MGILGRFRGRRRSGQVGRSKRADTSYLENWAATHQGVEAYIEPKTTVTDTTVVLIAHDGEWTRRRIPGPDAARHLGKKGGFPVYDVALTGYPQRMRDYTKRQTILRKRQEAERDRRPLN
jgi:hypothetical protein